MATIMHFENSVRVDGRDDSQHVVSKTKTLETRDHGLRVDRVKSPLPVQRHDVHSASCLCPCQINLPSQHEYGIPRRPLGSETELALRQPLLGTGIHKPLVHKSCVYLVPKIEQTDWTIILAQIDTPFLVDGYDCCQILQASAFGNLPRMSIVTLPVRDAYDCSDEGCFRKALGRRQAASARRLPGGADLCR